MKQTYDNYYREYYQLHKKQMNESTRKCQLNRRRKSKDLQNISSRMFGDDIAANMIKHDTELEKQRVRSKIYWLNRYHTDKEFKKKQDKRNLEYRNGKSLYELNEYELIIFKNNILILNNKELSEIMDCSRWCISFLKHKYKNIS
jgi:hypothetical protein